MSRNSSIFANDSNVGEEFVRTISGYFGREFFQVFFTDDTWARPENNVGPIQTDWRHPFRVRTSKLEIFGDDLIKENNTQ